MAVIPYLSQGQVQIDPATGMAKKKGSANTSPILNQRMLETAAAGGGVLPPSFGGPSASPLGPVTIPGFTPDYKALIQGDPVFSQLRADLASLGVADASQRAAGTQRAIAQFGLVPGIEQLQGLNQGFLNEDITPEARMLAQRNTEAGLSITARQEQQFKDMMRQMKNALAARGALRSGEAGFQAQNLQRDYDRAKFDTTQELVDFLSGLQAGFAEKERQRRLQEAQGAESAMNRQIGLNPATPDRVVNPGEAGYPAPPAAPSAPNIQQRDDSAAVIAEMLRLAGLARPGQAVGQGGTTYAI